MSKKKETKKSGKKFPTYKSDEDAEKFVGASDLAQYDFSTFTPMNFEVERKTAQVNLRMPESLLKVLKDRAKARGIPYQRFIREALEKALR